MRIIRQVNVGYYVKRVPLIRKASRRYGKKMMDEESGRERKVVGLVPRAHFERGHTGTAGREASCEQEGGRI
jgi:hypothetical protein